MTDAASLRLLVSIVGCWTTVALAVSPRGESTAENGDDEARIAAPAIPDPWAGDVCSSFAEAERLSKCARARSRRAAIRIFEQLLAHPEVRRDATLEAIVASRLGDLHRGLGATEESILFYRRALASSAERPDIRVEAQVGMSRSLLRVDEIGLAATYARNALELSRATGDETGEIAALNAVGIAMYHAGNLPGAAETFHRALHSAASSHDIAAYREAALHLAFTRANAGEDQRAIEELLTLVDSGEGIPDANLRATALVALGHAYSKVGDKQRAFEIYQQAAPLLEILQDPYKSASYFIGMGYLYDELGDLATAGEFYEKALQLYERVGSSYGVAACLIHLGRVQAAAASPHEALTSFGGALSRLRGLDEEKLEAVVHAEIADIQASFGDDALARESYSRALALNRPLGDERVEAEIQNSFGDLDLRSGDLAGAELRFRRAQELSRKSASPFVQARALFNLARVERASGRPEEALELLEHGLDLVESLRLNVGSHRLRASFVASVYEMHLFHVDLLMELHARTPDGGFDERAFRASERAKARSLSDKLRHADGSERSTPDDELARYLMELEEKLRLESAGADSESLRRLVVEIDRVRTLMRPDNGARDVTDVRDVTIAEIRDGMLDEGTAVLAYLLGDPSSYLWVVTPSSFTSFELPSRGRLETELSALHGLLAVRSTRPGETARQRQLRLEDAEHAYWRAASQLSRLLIGPAMGELQGVNRLLVAGDGMLHQIPVSALPVPSSDPAPSSSHEPLASRFEIVRLPSVLTLKLLEERSAVRPAPQKRLAVVADPVYDASDPRLPMTGERQPEPLPSLERSPPSLAPEERIRAVLRDMGPEKGGMARLLSTRLEARSILRLVPLSERFEALGFDATRSLVTSGELSSYEVVHFAAHGIVDTDLPELSGIVLSLFDPDGERRDGFLRLHDLYGLDLPVRLVVLSACSTALGKPVRGEGLVGLVDGFLSAGARGVMASYWDVDDEATSELMKRFYEQMFVAGRPPAKALQLAQRSMWAERRWRSPRLWAAFELHGGWR